VLLCLEAAKAGNRDGVLLRHLISDHVPDALERFAHLSPGES
jgi:hypothetical protein